MRSPPDVRTHGSAHADPSWFAGLGGPAVRAIAYPRSSALTPLVPLDYPTISCVSDGRGTPPVGRWSAFTFTPAPSLPYLCKRGHRYQGRKTQSGTGIPDQPRPLLGARKTGKWHPPGHPGSRSPNPNNVLAPPVLEPDHETNGHTPSLPTRLAAASRTPGAPSAPCRVAVGDRAGGLRSRGIPRFADAGKR
jgi:hypothetical protein